MFSKKSRIKKKKDFDKIFKRGRFFREDFLTLIVLSNNLKNSRFGFVVSKKFSKKAVLRNRIKRQLRGLIRAKLKKLANGIDFLIIVSPTTKVKDFWEIEGLINKLFEKSGMI